MGDEDVATGDVVQEILRHASVTHPGTYVANCDLPITIHDSILAGMSHFKECSLCVRLRRAHIEALAELIRLDGELRDAIVAGDELRVANLGSHVRAAERHRFNAHEASMDHRAAHFAPSLRALRASAAL